jgi:two-component system OmpR family response regulator
MDAPDHVLIVDDDRELRGLLSGYLQKQGYRVTAVADGKAMRAAISTSHPDVIVLDVMLPGEDGFSLCRDLRARSHTPSHCKMSFSPSIVSMLVKAEWQ